MQAADLAILSDVMCEFIEKELYYKNGILVRSNKHLRRPSLVVTVLKQLRGKAIGCNLIHGRLFGILIKGI